VLPLGRDRGIDAGGKRDFEDRLATGLAILGVVVSPFEIVERGPDVDRAVMVRADSVTRHAGEPRRLGQRHVDLGRRRCVIDPLDGRAKFFRQFVWFEKPLEGPMGIDARGNDRSLDRATVGKLDSGGAPAGRHDPRDFGFAEDLDSQVAASASDRRAQSSHPALDIAPDSAGAARLSRHVVQEHVGASR
jgi:hypothetical protein